MKHYLFDLEIDNRYQLDLPRIILGMGCFWGAERLFWQLPGVYCTSVGYAGGNTTNPSYREVCTGTTGHAEVVEIIYYPDRTSLDQLLEVFFTNHDSTQINRQGNDRGTQYRSILMVDNLGATQTAQSSLDYHQKLLTKNHFGKIATTVEDSTKYYLAEDYHQQYLAKNPMGYCGLKRLELANS